jgi:hypothetical protein
VTITKIGALYRSVPLEIRDSKIVIRSLPARWAALTALSNRTPNPLSIFETWQCSSTIARVVATNHVKHHMASCGFGECGVGLDARGNVCAQESSPCTVHAQDYRGLGATAEQACRF